ncbi:hypothetical protein DFJ73DRAFT_382706 [Zopfochytrium polystomum]|nr:hypothetical protein DFJ73DRAFT_382706 [Zopfochytrium polystomum]
MTKLPRIRQKTSRVLANGEAPRGLMASSPSSEALRAKFFVQVPSCEASNSEALSSAASDGSNVGSAAKNDSFTNISQQRRSLLTSVPLAHRDTHPSSPGLHFCSSRTSSGVHRTMPLSVSDRSTTFGFNSHSSSFYRYPINWDDWSKAQTSSSPRSFSSFTTAQNQSMMSSFSNSTPTEANVPFASGPSTPLGTFDVAISSFSPLLEKETFGAHQTFPLEHRLFPLLRA